MQLARESRGLSFGGDIQGYLRLSVWVMNRRFTTQSSNEILHASCVMRHASPLNLQGDNMKVIVGCYKEEPIFYEKIGAVLQFSWRAFVAAYSYKAYTKKEAYKLFKELLWLKTLFK